MTHILLARHGETEWNKVGRVQGWTDIPLSTDGEAQAIRLARRLSDISLAAVYSSDLSRAAQTAKPAADTQGLKVQTLESLREKGYGDWEGLTGPELERDYKQLWHRYHTLRDLTAKVPNGETWPEVQKRMSTALQNILAAHPGTDETVLVVGHGASSRMLILEALHAPLPVLLHFFLDNASLSRLDFFGDHSRLVSLNDTGHLVETPA